MSLIRSIYFVYVLYRVKKSSESNWRAFFGRPSFMNWLPILILTTSISAFFFGVSVLKATVNGSGQVICRLDNIDLIFTVVATYLTGLCHYMFAAEFLNTKQAL